MKKKITTIVAAVMMMAASAVSVFALPSNMSGVQDANTADENGARIIVIDIDTVETAVEEYDAATTDEEKEAVIQSAVQTYKEYLQSEITERGGVELTDEQLDEVAQIVMRTSIEANATTSSVTDSTALTQTVIELLAAAVNTTANDVAKELEEQGLVMATTFFNITEEGEVEKVDGGYNVRAYVTLPEDQEFKVLHYSVVRGVWELLDASYEDGILTFFMEDFSPAAIFTVPSDTTTTTTTTTDSTSTTSPKTGVQSTWIGFMAGAAALLTVSGFAVKKSRKKA